MRESMRAIIWATIWATIWTWAARVIRRDAVRTTHSLC
jgi:hypothetical protein